MRSSTNCSNVRPKQQSTVTSQLRVPAAKSRPLCNTTEYLGNTIGEWNSKELLQIDLATDLLLDDYIEDWQSYGVAVRADMVHQFRVFLESCPHCNGELTYHQDSMETCCQEYGVIIGECVSCNIEVFKKQASIDT